jgi:type I restriction enzyme, S subunit
MKQGWEIKSLGEIADVEYGFTDKSTEVGHYRYVRITDIDDNGELISTEKKYLKHSKEATSFLLQDNDLLMARTGATFAKVLLYKDFEPSVFASYLIRIKFKEKIDNKLYWYFSKTKSYWEQANNLASGAAQPHFNGAAVKQVIFSYPKSLPEQQRIVSILDEAFAAIAKAKANAEQNLKNAKELFESYLQGVFENGNWETKKLSELFDTGAGGTPLKSHKDYYEGGNIPWLRSGEVNQRDIIECELFITEKGLKNSSARLFPKDTVLIAMYGATAGQVGILRFECSTNQAVCGIYPNKNMIPEFLYYKFIAGKKALVDQAVGGAQPNISQIKIKNTLVPFISLNEQQTIVRQLDALRAETQKLEAVYQKKIADLEELKKSILQKAFAGELMSEPLIKAD